MTIQAYPLQWPDGWHRTAPSKRWGGRFYTTFAKARDELLEELRLLGAKGVVLSTAIPTRRDGLPYAGRSWRSGDDPGVAVYFSLDGRPKAIACDTYSTPEANIRAVGLSVEALRALGRHGVAGMLDRAFQGFEALPSPDSLDWRAVMGFTPAEKVDTKEVKARYRSLSRSAHPDTGGSEKAMTRLNQAYDLALQETGDR
jgi:hypothetical protein